MEIYLRKCIPYFNPAIKKMIYQVYKIYAFIRYARYFDKFLFFRGIYINIGRDISMLPQVKLNIYEKTELDFLESISIKANSYLRQAPIKIALPDYPVPTSYYLTKKFYPNEDSILKACEKLFNRKIQYKKILRPKHHDIPNKDFNGPF
jgi:hypothetical protein